MRLVFGQSAIPECNCCEYYRDDILARLLGILLRVQHLRQSKAIPDVGLTWLLTIATIV